MSRRKGAGYGARARAAFCAARLRRDLERAAVAQDQVCRVKYEEVYLRAYDTVSEARASVGRYLDLYNRRRPRSSLDGTTPDQAYFNPLQLRLAA